MSARLLALLVFVFAIGTTPGPTNAMVSASGANFGYRRTLPHILGTLFGLPALIVAMGLGLGRLFQAHPPLQQGLKVAGSAYLLYLAWRVVTAGRPQGPRGGGRPLTFVEAAAFQWVNPKIWLAGLAALASYARAADGYWADTLVVAAAFCGVVLLATNLWCLGGVAIGRALASRRARLAFNLVMGLLIVLSIALLYL
ncbi:MAG TPA: LysE family translocator [bacterium]|nr:LysE family translocator [bacterium]